MEADWVSEFFDVSVFSVQAGQLRALAPYLWLAVGIALATVAAGLSASRIFVRTLQAVILIPFAAFLLWTFREPTQALLGTSLEVDSLTRLVGASVAIIGTLTGFFSGRRTGDVRAEWSPLMLIGILGMSLLPGAKDWVSFFVALETLAIAGYVLTAFDYHRESSLEASLKYLLMGAFASSLLLMGMTLFYGAFGTFEFEAIKGFMSSGHYGANGFVIAGGFLIFASLAFKVALAPFHMWAPDVYQGAPSPAAAFLATATKITVFGAMALAFDRSGFWWVPGLSTFVGVVGMISIVVGNLLAVAQRKVRRILAYSSVANAGYAALALSVGPSATGSMMTALVIYGVAVVAAFAMVDVLTKALPGKDRYDLDVEELGQAAARAPRVASVVFGLCLFSLAGIPPLPGFLGKYVVLRDIWSAGFLWGAGVMVFGTLLGLAYYLRLLIPMFLEGSEKPVRRDTSVRPSWASLVAGGLSAVVLLGCLVGFSRLQQWMEIVETFSSSAR
jgi:NADH-quinone oxidoreductase subunit N